MATFLYKTKGNADPKGKPRVYFTCHSDDFERYFEKITTDIFKTHDCAIYYTEDMTQHIDETEMETDLGQMNLFVVPVTLQLLTQPNRAMYGDIAYAKQENIPILPFMMEQGIDNLYSKPDKFGLRQYLNPSSADLTEISYENKLKKYLESVLISDETAKRIRAAFDAYIFLSYRKKDRKYANELMKLIHRNPEFRDIAIWYDEFLTPGESFVDSIQKALEDSKLFALLVTPSLLEEPEGKPNFAMAEEYPAAIKAEKTVLPAEMVQTDRNALADKFPCIPDCADPRDEADFKNRLMQALQKIAISANNDDPEHNFLIGLAYLEGIDVEVNRKRGLELITSAAEADLPDAMKKLYDLYTNVSFDFPEAQKWALGLAECYVQQRGYGDPVTLDALFSAAQACGLCGKLRQAAVLYCKAFYFRKKVLGLTHPDTLTAMHEVATHTQWDDYKKRRRLQEAYELRCQVLGDADPDTLHSLDCLAWACEALEDYEIALNYHHKSVRTKILKGYRVSSNSLKSIADIYGKLGDTEREKRWRESEFAMKRSSVGEDPIDNAEQVSAMLDYWLEAAEDENFYYDTYGLTDINGVIMAISECINAEQDFGVKLELGQFLFGWFLGEEYAASQEFYKIAAEAYQELEEYTMELSLREKIYAQKQQEYGDNHRETIEALEQLCAARKNVLGNGHPDVVAALKKLASGYLSLGDVDRSLSCREQIVDSLTAQYGPVHEKLRLDLLLLASTSQKCGRWEDAVKHMERLNDMNRQLYGAENAVCINTMAMLVNTYYGAGHLEQAYQVCNDAYELSCKVLGLEHEQTLKLRQNLQIIEKAKQ